MTAVEEDVEAVSDPAAPVRNIRLFASSLGTNNYQCNSISHPMLTCKHEHEN